MNFRILENGEQVLDGDFINLKPHEDKELGKNGLPVGAIRVNEWGEIHIGHTMNGNEACYAIRIKFE